MFNGEWLMVNGELSLFCTGKFFIIHWFKSLSIVRIRI